ncbi:hypothetical protein ACMD2_26712 [Ananas comosus]|uniref:Uncharacterized protein n=1 Tax=Ananas comosus TaxID=4615 RepID=A0A199V6X0_ANACO|nr:hypothetical protein ACMD2_26712 [Ananas comosus]
MSSGDPIDHLGLRNVLHLPRPLFDLLLRSNFEDLSDFEVVLFTNPSSIPNCGSSLLFLCCFLCLFSAKLSSNSDDGLREITIDTGALRQFYLGQRSNDVSIIRMNIV